MSLSLSLYLLLTITGYKDTDFETGMGMWKNIGQIQWLRHKGPTKTINTGPFRDHTTNKGLVLFI